MSNRFWMIAAALVGWFGMLQSQAMAQPPAPGVLQPPPSVLPPPPGVLLPEQGLVAVAAGVPYGVAMIEIPLRNPVLGDGPPPLRLIGPPARTFFSVTENVQVRAADFPSERPLPAIGQGRLLGRVNNLIREVVGGDATRNETVARRVTFLFSGDEPFTVKIADWTGVVGSFDIRPVPNPRERDRLLADWWSDFTDHSQQQIARLDTPPWLQTYLVGMLSGRLGLPLPAWYGNTADEAQRDPLLMTLDWIGGAARVSNRVFASAAAGRDLDAANLPAAADVAAEPLPAPIAWQSVPAASELAPGAAAPEIEPIANRIPPECFYIRYGKFENYLWYQDLTDEFGGDVSRMITLSGLSNDGAAGLTRQLGLQSTVMGRVLGPTIITDQAIIGRDLYLQDGAAMGVVFQPTNAFLLRTSLNNDRKTLVNQSDAVTLQDVTLAHGRGTLMRSSDNSVRSYMVEQNGFICVTNSSEIADRFLEVGQTGESLGKTEGFQIARTLHPLSVDDTIFAYFSPEMQQGLLTPQYLIELRRRMQSEADIALVYLARLAAANQTSPQSQPLREIEPLVEAGFLPVGFGERPDGSGVFALGDQVLDSRRGGRGTFLPIPDSPVDYVTPTEASWYNEIAAAYSQQFRTLDPIFVGVKRELITAPDAATDQTGDVNASGTRSASGPGNRSGDGNPERRERLTVHAEVAPWQPENYGSWAKQLGPPTPVAIRFAPDDIVAVQAHVISDVLGPPTHMFAAIKDSHPPQPDAFNGILGSYQALQGLPGYLGAWPLPGMLDRLPLGIGRGQPVGPHMTRLLGGIYRYTGGEFSILSFDPGLLAATIPQLAAEEVNDSAQLRAHVGNLHGSQLEAWVNEFLYRRASVSSLAEADFLASLTEDLGVAPDKALEQARLILGSDVQCVLGGKLEPIPPNPAAPGAPTRWRSTAWGMNNEVPPAYPPTDYEAPILNWFRGANGTLTQYPNRLVADFVLEISRVNTK